MARWTTVHRLKGTTITAQHAPVWMECAVNLDRVDAIEEGPDGTARLVWNQGSPRCEWRLNETFDHIQELVID